MTKSTSDRLDAYFDSSVANCLPVTQPWIATTESGFLTSPGVYEKRKRLCEECDAKQPLKQPNIATDHGVAGAFLTAHMHFTTAVVELLHLGCNLYHPEAVPPAFQEQNTDG